MNILDLHGMGGGSTSRVPNRLRQELSKMHFTKDGEPCELNVIGESMGSIHAIGIQGIPHIYISPALNFDRGAEVARPIYAIANVLGINLTPEARGPKRQELKGDPDLLAKFKPMLERYKDAVLKNPHRDPSFAFFGRKDKYMMLGIVSIKEYERLYGDSYEVSDSGHTFGVRYVKPRLIPKIVEMLDLNK